MYPSQRHQTLLVLSPTFDSDEIYILCSSHLQLKKLFFIQHFTGITLSRLFWNNKTGNYKYTLLEDTSKNTTGFLVVLCIFPCSTLEYIKHILVYLDSSSFCRRQRVRWYSSVQAFTFWCTLVLHTICRLRVFTITLFGIDQRFYFFQSFYGKLCI
jgi:hypothetical protein